MIIGRMTAQAGKSRLTFNSEYQHRCEGTPLKVDAQGCHNRGSDWIGLGNNAAPTQMSPEATSTAARGYFDVPFYVNQGIVDDGGDATSCCSRPAIRRSAISRSSASRRPTASRT